MLIITSKDGDNRSGALSDHSEPSRRYENVTSGEPEQSDDSIITVSSGLLLSSEVKIKAARLEVERLEREQTQWYTPKELTRARKTLRLLMAERKKLRKTAQPRLL